MLEEKIESNVWEPELNGERVREREKSWFTLHNSVSQSGIQEIPGVCEAKWRKSQATSIKAIMVIFYFL